MDAPNATAVDFAPWYHADAVLPAPVARRDVKQRELDGQRVIFDPLTGSTFRFNETAALVWDTCTPGATINEIVERLMAHYAVDRERAADDVEQLLLFFAGHGLLDPS